MYLSWYVEFNRRKKKNLSGKLKTWVLLLLLGKLWSISTWQVGCRQPWDNGYFGGRYTDSALTEHRWPRHLAFTATEPPYFCWTLSAERNIGKRLLHTGNKPTKTLNLGFFWNWVHEALNFIIKDSWFCFGRNKILWKNSVKSNENY